MSSVYSANGSDNYRSRELIDALGMSLRQLQWLDETKMVVPRHQGRVRYWSRQDAYLAAVTQRVRGIIPSGERLRRAMRQAARILKSGPPRFLIAGKESLWAATTESELVARLEACSQKHIPVIVLDTDVIRTKLQNKSARGARVKRL